MNEDLKLILSCFSGEDGGVSFTKLRVLIDNMEKQANNGDEAAQQILLVVQRFANLIRITQQ